MAGYARELGVRIETASRVDTLPGTGDGPVIVATSLDAARILLGDDSLRGPGGRTVLIDLGFRSADRRGTGVSLGRGRGHGHGRGRRTDAFIVSDLDAPGWLERFTVQDPSLAPTGHQLVQGQLPIAPGESRADGVAHAERLLDLGFPAWRERVAWRQESVATGRTGALDLPGTTWRDRQAIDRGNGVYLAGDEVAAPGMLCEVSFNSAIEATTLALKGRSAVERRGV
jgi:phytoene dehydrogenase-like protein